MNGTHYDLKYGGDGVYLIVYPSSEGLSRKEEIEIVNYLKRKKIKQIDIGAVFEAIYATPPREIKIAPLQEEETIDEELEIRIADKGMKAYANSFLLKVGNCSLLKMFTNSSGNMGLRMVSMIELSKEC